jgi:acyl-CoA thioesterase-2
MTQTVDEVVAGFVRSLDVERVMHDRFVGASGPREHGRIFGGLVLAQAAIAGWRTVGEDRRLHSLHAYFVRGGKPELPIEYHVERVRDGRTFTARRILVRQGDEAICDVTTSFVRPEEGLSHQIALGDVPSPESLPEFREPDEDPNEPQVWPFELRLVSQPGEAVDVDEPDAAWIRLRGMLPDDPVVHTAAIIYDSDAGSFAGIERRYGWDTMDFHASASLDHAIWIHRPIRWDSWIYTETETPVANGGRALTFRKMYLPDGTHFATMAQEAIARQRRQ